MIDVEQFLNNLSTQDRDAAIRQAIDFQQKAVFIPSVGPQYDAYYSPADIMLYGGSAGSGKTALLLGLALTQHKRSLIMRRHYGELSALTDEAIKFNGSRDGFNGSPPPSLRAKDGRLVEFGACQYAGDEQKFQGKAHDFLGLDEAVNLLESQVRFLMGWVRTTDVGQRCRTVLATNPPVTSSGDWIIGFFRPWLDPTHHNPAKAGELRWFVTDPDGKDTEVDGPTPVQFGSRTVIPTSRTFIPGKLDDNPYLARTDYAARLDGLPEPLRSAVRDGNFMLSRDDPQDQCIPTAWVRDAMARWTDKPPQGVPMCAMGVDVAQGGKDNTVIAMRYDGWYDKLLVVSGDKTPYGRDVAGLVVGRRRDNATIVLDMGGGYGGGAFECLRANNIDDIFQYKGGLSATTRTKDGALKFKNMRTQAYWRFREALASSQSGGSPIILPDDPELLSDLTTPKYTVPADAIILENKEDVIDRIGRSPDKGDAVVMAWMAGAKAADSYGQWKTGAKRAQATRVTSSNSWQGRKR